MSLSMLEVVRLCTCAWRSMLSVVSAYVPAPVKLSVFVCLLYVLAGVEESRVLVTVRLAEAS